LFAADQLLSDVYLLSGVALNRRHVLDLSKSACRNEQFI